MYALTVGSRSFQSTQPSQAVTYQRDELARMEEISIHTALAGCDIMRDLEMSIMQDFNPHSPRRL